MGAPSRNRERRIDGGGRFNLRARAGRGGGGKRTNVISVLGRHVY